MRRLGLQKSVLRRKNRQQNCVKMPRYIYILFIRGILTHFSPENNGDVHDTACGACGKAASLPASVVNVAQRERAQGARPRVINSKRSK